MHAIRSVAALAAFALAGTAQAETRHFQPVAATPAQVVSVVGSTPVISANGTAFAGGASVMPFSARKARLLVSFRNLGAAPIRVDGSNVEAVADGKPLALEAAAAASANGNENESMSASHCMSVPKDFYSSCMASAVHKVRVDTEHGGAKSRQETADAVAVPPKQTQPMQFVVDLPKRARNTPAALTVTLHVGDEKLAFEFREVE